MSNISDIVQSAQGGRLTEHLAQRYGLAPWQAQAAVSALIPALSAGFAKAVEEPGSLRLLIETVYDPRHRAAFENAEHAYSEAAAARGGEIVEQLFGSPSTAGQIAQFASRESGVRADILQQLLPALASIVAGGLYEALEKDGRVASLARLAGEAPESQAAPIADEARAAATKPPAGGLLALLSGVVAGLFGRKAEQKTAAEAPAPSPPESEADPLQEALNHIREALEPGATVSADHQASLDDLFGRVFGTWRS